MLQQPLLMHDGFACLIVCHATWLCSPSKHIVIIRSLPLSLFFLLPLSPLLPVLLTTSTALTCTVSFSLSSQVNPCSDRFLSQSLPPPGILLICYWLGILAKLFAIPTLSSFLLPLLLPPFLPSQYIMLPSSSHQQDGVPSTSAIWPIPPPSSHPITFDGHFYANLPPHLAAHAQTIPPLSPPVQRRCHCPPAVPAPTPVSSNNPF